MKKSLLTLFIFFSLFSGAQNPLVKMWDRRFGGTLEDRVQSFQQTHDGGYMLAGFSRSGISGDKTQSVWGSLGVDFDYWIVKLDSLGNKEWDKDIGGTDDDYLFSIQQTSDEGYILGGRSRSEIGGDKTEASNDTLTNYGDYWIVKVDSIGNKEWDRDFGGGDEDELFSIHQTMDGGYILAGDSWSGVGIDKTEGSWGGSDYWIIKVDLNGNKLWDKVFGGDKNDRLTSLVMTKDGGYLLAGFTESGISGNKTAPKWGGLYSTDYWIVKIDSLGNKQWEKDFGGTGYDELHAIQQTSDEGFILGGCSESDISGDKTEPLWQDTSWLSDYDFWFLKIDSLGNKEWDKDLGGISQENDLGSVYQTTDAGYLFSGSSYSNIGGNKTESNLGYCQTWILKTDSTGTMQWDKTLLTIGNDFQKGLAIQSSDNCYVVLNSTYGGVGGYKTQPQWGHTDYWLIKFCDGALLPPNSLFHSEQNICPNFCVNILNFSTNATSFLWSFPGATPNTSTDVNPQNICYANPGNYDVQLIATNANGSDTLLLSNYITVYPSPPPQSITQDGDTLFAIAGSANYQWYFNTNIINGATDYFYIAPSSGDYNVVATDGNGCEVEAAVFNVLASAQAAVGSSSMQVFPNPTHDKVTIQKSQVTSGTAIEISIYNMMGEIIRNRYTDSRTKNQELTIDVSQLPPGMYWLEIKSGEKIFRSKFIKAGNR